MTQRTGVAVALLVAAGIAAPHEAVLEWDLLEKAVRGQTVSRDSASRWVGPLWPRLRAMCDAWPADAAGAWQFPVKGYGLRDIGSGGFRPDTVYGSSLVKGYCFYDGNAHGGHPAYDIFIRMPSPGRRE